MDKLSMSLDDIIKRDRNFGTFRSRGKRGNTRNSGFQSRNNSRGNVKKRFPTVSQNRFTPYKTRGDIDSQWKHDLYDGEENEVIDDVDDFVPENKLTKLLISNLEFGVSDYDLAELFGEFGPLISSEVHYDRSGRSLGTAEVTFKDKPSAVKAMNFYNGVPLDGRPMSIQLHFENSEPASYRPVRGRNRQAAPIRRKRGTNFTGFQRNSPRGRFNGNRNRSRNDVTAEQLDAELDSYVNAS